MSTRFLFMILTGAILCGSRSASGQARPDAGGSELTPSEKAVKEVLSETGRYFEADVLTLDQRLDTGRICEQLFSGIDKDGEIPLDLIRERAQMIREIVSPEQREQAERILESKRRRERHKYVCTMEMLWPEELYDRWVRELDHAEPEFLDDESRLGEFNERAAAEARMWQRLTSNETPDSGLVRNDLYDYMRTVLYLLKLDYVPYIGYRFDQRVLEDPALTPEQKNELATRMLSRSLRRHLGSDPPTKGLVTLEPTPDQVAVMQEAFEAAVAEMRNAAQGKVLDITNVEDAQSWFRGLYYGRARLMELLTEDQKKTLAMIRKTVDERVKLPFEIHELDREGLIRIDALNNMLAEVVADIPQKDWGRSMAYQEALLDHRIGYLRTAMRSPKMSATRKGQIARPMLDSSFPTIHIVFNQGAMSLLDSWPVIFPTGLPRDTTCSESFTGTHWLHLFELIDRKGILKKIQDAHLSHLARFIAAQVGDGRADEMFALEESAKVRAHTELMFAFFDSDDFTPLHKLIFFQSAWNQIGPFAMYFSALNLEPAEYMARMDQMRRLLVMSRSWPPESQMTFSVEDLARRQKSSIEAVHRWTEFGGHFSPEELKKLAAQKEKLNAWIDEWAQYVPFSDKERDEQPPIITVEGMH